MKRIKVLIVTTLFLILDIIVSLFMFNLWFKLFGSGVITTILILITLFGLMKAGWKTIDFLITNWK